MTTTLRRPQIESRLSSTLFVPEVEDITRRNFLIGAAGLALLPAGCGSGGASNGTRAFFHTMGETEVPAEPRRVVALHDTSITYPLLDVGFKPAASAGMEGEIRDDRKEGEPC